MFVTAIHQLFLKASLGDMANSCEYPSEEHVELGGGWMEQEARVHSKYGGVHKRRKRTIQALGNQYNKLRRWTVYLQLQAVSLFLRDLSA